jgi:hypothetical protein
VAYRPETEFGLRYPNHFLPVHSLRVERPQNGIADAKRAGFETSSKAKLRRLWGEGVKVLRL